MCGKWICIHSVSTTVLAASTAPIAFATSETIAPPPLLMKTQQPPPMNPTGIATACLECSVEARHLTRPKVVRGGVLRAVTLVCWVQ